MRRKSGLDGEELLDHFYDQTTSNPTTGCAVWLGLCNRQGYGRVRHKGRLESIHRLAYHLTNPEVCMDGLVVCHTCDNPTCIRIEHLFLGTHADNSADMVAKGRHATGEAHPSAKLTDDQVEEIRKSYDGIRGQKAALARTYGVSRTYIGYIINREYR